jgi:hypothetical protein
MRNEVTEADSSGKKEDETSSAMMVTNRLDQVLDVMLVARRRNPLEPPPREKTAVRW